VSSFVEHCDAREFHDEILSLFDRNGQPLPHQQFDWYYGHNGNASVLSWVLRGSAHGAISGLCSVVPRTFRFGDKPVRAGLVGNLMVDKDIRAIGGLALLRSVQSLVLNKQLDILLGMPTLAPPRRLVLRMGFRPIASWQTYVQIFRSRAALYSRYGTAGAALSPLVDSIAAVRRRFSYFREGSTSNLTLEELTRHQVSRLAVESWPPLDGCFLAEFSAAMLDVRFLRQPVENYRVIGITHRPDNSIRGYLVLDCRRGRVIVCHCRTDPRMLSDADAVLTLCHGGRRYGETVGVITLRGSTLSSVLERWGFVSLPASLGGCEHSLLGFWRPDHPLAQYFDRPSRWNVFPGFSDV
jgi:rhodanese-related sulfurtransferase